MERKALVEYIRRQMGIAKVVALLGPRQAGKTTLARQFARTSPLHFDEGLNYFDLEDPAQLQRLATPRLALEKLTGLVVIDEIQHRPDLFPVLRVLVDREKNPATFLILGSASRDLIRQGAETLAGRIAFVEIAPFSLGETGTGTSDALWIRGGFPRSFLAGSEDESWRWGSLRCLTETLNHYSGPLIDTSGLEPPTETHPLSYQLFQSISPFSDRQLERVLEPRNVQLKLLIRFHQDPHGGYIDLSCRKTRILD